MADKNTALDTLAREELGVDPDELGGSPWAAAGSSFSLFATGAIFPVAPFFWLDGLPAVALSVVLSGMALMAIGAGTSLFTGRSFAFSATRQLGSGLLAAAITYGIGRLIGVAVTG
jgi:VIT1/CCC1 family predicted Fe2+/Mn2+ transporter